jgi:hypothetical protein
MMMHPRCALPNPCYLCKVFDEIERIGYQLAEHGIIIGIFDPEEDLRRTMEARSERFDYKFMKRLKVTWEED